MPRIEKLVGIDGKLGIILDIPPAANDLGSVVIMTEEELQAKLAAERERCAKVAEQTWVNVTAERSRARIAHAIRALK